ncbi:hypothetical protein ACFUTV_26705 [Streptomyces sp. NPDC057298]|uniref:hypothetical protein n=1 Tax=Streptomyces sp. NPDC057298 TaxID=3346091 RepID=UPI0036250E8F
MSVHAQQFFNEYLTLPFAESSVFGDTYYATSLLNFPLRPRIGFSYTIREDEYDGLRLTVIHRENQDIDSLVLPFEEHGTFTRRDATREIQPGYSGYARTLDLRGHNCQPPWSGEEVGGLRSAIEQYRQVWFPEPGRAPHAPGQRPALRRRSAPPQSAQCSTITLPPAANLSRPSGEPSGAEHSPTPHAPPSPKRPTPRVNRRTVGSRTRVLLGVCGHSCSPVRCPSLAPALKAIQDQDLAVADYLECYLAYRHPLKTACIRGSADGDHRGGAVDVPSSGGTPAGGEDLMFSHASPAA